MKQKTFEELENEMIASQSKHATWYTGMVDLEELYKQFDKAHASELEALLWENIENLQGGW